MPNPCGPCIDSPESFRTMRLYLGRFLFAALFSALLLAVFFAAMSLRNPRSQKLRNCNKHPPRLAYHRSERHDLVGAQHCCAPAWQGPCVLTFLRCGPKEKGAPVKPGRLKWPEMMVETVRAYAVTGTPASPASGAAEPPATSPTLKRTKRRTEIFSPSFAIACVIISPIVTDSSLM